MNPVSRPQHHVTWPAHRFYWALLDASVLPRRFFQRGPDRRTLGYLFESELPVPIDHIHAVYLPLGDNRFIACGIEHERLATDTSPREALTLSPDEIPEEVVPHCPVDPRSFNLLTGPNEPAPVRRERYRFIGESAAVAALLLLAVVLGAQRRIDAWNRATAQMQAKSQAVYDELYPRATSAPSVQPAPLRLVAELRQLERTRGRAAQSPDLEEPQSGHTLAALLQRWPTEQPIMTESISVTPASVTLIGLLPTAPAAQGFVSAFQPPDGWEARQPQISVVADGVRLTWRLVRRAHAPLASRAPDSADGGRP